MLKVLALAVLIATPLAAQPAIPDTPMGHALSDYLAAFNSGDAAKIEAFNAAYHFDEKVKEQLRDFHESGGYILRKIESSDATTIKAFVQEKDGDSLPLVTIQKIGTPEAPKLFINFNGAFRPAEFAIPRLSQTEALKALDDRAAALAAQDRLSGTLLVAQNGKVLYSHAWGMADRVKDIPNTLDTRLRIGSDNKMFTAVAVLQLVAAGKLSLDGKIADYLPGYPNKDLARKATVRMLLSHSGGTGDFFGPQFDRDRLKFRDNEDYIAAFGNHPAAFEPGSKEQYSNFGFIILGSIIQHVSGQDYYAYVREHIFKPAGMNDTGSLPETTAVPNRAVAYTWKNGKWSAVDDLPWRGTAAGGGYTTAPDLLKFAAALEDGKLLPPALKDQATHFQTRGKWYGFGFAINGEKGPEHWYGHGGGAPGQNADWRVFPESGTVVITLANMDPSVANRLSEFYINRMPLDQRGQ